MSSSSVDSDKNQSLADYCVGFRQVDFPYEDVLVQAALWYPSLTKPVSFRAGAFELSVAKDAPAVPGKKPCVVLSHGSGTSPLSHRMLAARLASQGFVVAAPLHPQDNWRDQSGIGSFAQWGARPIVLSRLLDQLLNESFHDLNVDPDNVGMFGHSMGGYSVLALLSGSANVENIISHCQETEDDSIFCNHGGEQAKKSARLCPPLSIHKDTRIKCAVVASPIVVPIDRCVLQSVDVPLLVLRAANEDFLNNKYHSDVLAQNVSENYLTIRSIASATHFSFIEPSEYGRQGERLSAGKALAGIREEVQQATISFFATHLN